MKKQILFIAGFLLASFPFLGTKAQIQLQLERQQRVGVGPQNPGQPSPSEREPTFCGGNEYILTCNSSASAPYLQVLGTPNNDNIQFLSTGSAASSCISGRLVIVVSRVCSNATSVSVYTYEGADRIDASFLAENYSIYMELGPGPDKAKGGQGDDEIHGGAGNDHIWGEEGSDEIYGDGGHDKIDGGLGGDRIYGGSGNDQLFTGEHSEEEACQFRPVTFFDDAGLHADSAEGGEGNDCIDARGKVLTHILGGPGNDHIKGMGNIFGGEGNDVINALITTEEDCQSSPSAGWSSGETQYFGDAGNDKIKGHPNFSDVLNGGEGNDYFLDDGPDRVINQIYGDQGGDMVLVGGLHNDYFSVETIYDPNHGGCSGAHCNEPYYSANNCDRPQW